MWLVAIVAVLLAVAVWCLWTAVLPRDSRSADERLAEIEAARAIPDSENAAMIYNELLQDPNAASVLSYCPEFLEPPIFNQVRDKPWLGKDHPELVGWIKGHQYISDRLLEASRLEKCRFPISIDLTDMSQMNRAAPMRQWGFLLSMVANNDLAEGRIDGAMAKWQCILRMGSHLRQQPMLIDHLVASALEEVALKSMARFVVTGDATESHLQAIEAMPLPTKDSWAEHRKAIRSVEDLRSQKVMEPFGPLDRLRYHVVSFRMKRAVNSATGGMLNQSPLDESGYQCRRPIATARGIRILVALKRHKTATNHWPQSLDEIKSSLSEEILTDPLNKGPFVYKPAGGTFTLYSKGENNIDENGRWEPEAGADDWPIWPLRGRSAEPERQDANGV